jgi:GNAT superfamily N-acetyltransferase
VTTRSHPQPPSPDDRPREIRDGKLDAVTDPVFAVKPLDEGTWPAFAQLVEDNNGIFGGCWCMGFHPEGVGKDTTPAANRDRKLSRVRAGTANAALVFDDDACVGWCQFGVPEEQPRIKSRAAYERESTTPPDWRIACCYVGKGHRRRGVATAALTGALDLIAGLGGGRVGGLPGGRLSRLRRLYNGALSTYEHLGFTKDRKIGKHRWLVTRVVDPAG